MLLTNGEQYNSDIVEKQEKRWFKFYQTFCLKVAVDFKSCEKYSVIFDDIKLSFQVSKSNVGIFNFFKGVFTPDQKNRNEISNKLDSILSLLVKNFDDEELELAEKVRLNKLVIENDGDVEKAKLMMKTEKEIYQEEIDLLDLITNASFNPEESGVTHATQVLSILIGRNWILSAYKSFIEWCDSLRPAEFLFSVDNFKFSTTDGNNEEEVLAKMKDYYQELLAYLIEKRPKPIGLYVFGGISCLIGLLAHGVIGAFLFFIIAGIILIVLGVSKDKNTKLKIEKEIKKRKKDTTGIIHECLSEIREYHIEYNKSAHFIKQIFSCLSYIKKKNNHIALQG